MIAGFFMILFILFIIGISIMSAITMILKYKMYYVKTRKDLLKKYNLTERDFYND